MYKLLIVEDEIIFRNVLPQIIDWNSIGFEVAAVVENGYRALEILPELQPDVILTDIRMPVFNGLELAMEVKLKYPNIKVLLLSAFNEFDYARKGIDCGIYGYILKSDGEEEIVKYFAKLKKALDEENMINLQGSKLWDERESLVKKILASNDNISSVDLKEAKRILFADSSEMCVSLFKIDEYQYIISSDGPDKAQKISHTIRNIIYHNIERQNKGIVLSIDDLVCVFWNKSDDTYGAMTSEALRCIDEQLGVVEGNIEEKFTVSCSVGTTATNIKELRRSYQNAKSALNRLVYMDAGSIVHHEELLKKCGTLTFTEEEKLIKEILPYLHNKYTDNIIKYLSNIQDEFISKRIADLDMLSGFAVKLVLALVNDIGKMGIKSESFLTKSNYFIKEIGNLQTIRTIFGKLEAFLIEAFVVLNEDDNVQNRKIVDEAVQYIQKNYAKQITLEEVARYVNVHPVHLSRIFSKDLGETFKRVLMETRIEEAKRLLKNIYYKVYEISSLVGYEKPRYFSELFRNMTGLTPLEYREKYKA